jgi:hypothetical protein
VDRLPEQPVVVADAVAEGGDADRGHALHEAGGEAAQAAVAERRVRLELADHVDVDAELAQGVAAGPGQAQVADGVGEQAPDQELEAEIVDALVAARLDLRVVAIQRSTTRSRTASAVAAYQSWSRATAGSLPTA